MFPIKSANIEHQNPIKPTGIVHSSTADAAQFPTPEANDYPIPADHPRFTVQQNINRKNANRLLTFVLNADFRFT